MLSSKRPPRRRQCCGHERAAAAAAVLLTAGDQDAAEADAGDEGHAEGVQLHAEPAGGGQEEEPGPGVAVLVGVEGLREASLGPEGSHRAQAGQRGRQVGEDWATSCTERGKRRDPTSVCHEEAV